MELHPIIISTIQGSRIALTVSCLFRADVKKMKFHGDYTFSSYPTFLGCSLVVRQMSLDKLSVPPHCLKDTEVSEDLGVHHLLSPRAHMMKL
jgi:hypothetical protein